MAHRRAGSASSVDREKIQSIIGVVMQSLDQPHVLFSGFNALTFFCEKASPPQQQQIVREGGVHVMLATMWTNFNNGELMSLVCNCLWCLSVGQDGIKSMIAKEGGIPAILVALRSHPSNPDLVRSPWVAESGIQSLSVALRRERPDDLLSCSKLKIPGARELNIRSILTVMSSVHDPIVIQLACDALWILALSRANVAVIARLDGIQAIAEQMQSYPTHVDMLKSACGALWNVSENSESCNRAPMGQSGVSKFFGSTRVVIDAMSTHPGHPELQKNALSYLRNAASDPAARSVLEKDNAIGVLLSVLRVFRSDPEFNEIALDVLLCLDYSALRSLVYDGLLAAVAPLFKLYQDAFEIIRRACMLVSLLLSHASPGIISSKSWMLLTQPHGLARTLLRLSRRMGLGSAVLSAVCGALSALSQLIVKEAKSDGIGPIKPDEVIRVASGLLREDDVRCLCETMRHNRSSLSLLTTVARIFHNLVVLQPSSGNGKYLSAGAELVLCEAMAAHPQELELHSLSVVAIGVLLGSRRTSKSRNAAPTSGGNQSMLLVELCNSLTRFITDPKHTSRCLRGLAHCVAGPDDLDRALEVLLMVMNQYIGAPPQVRDCATVIQSFLVDASDACCSPQTRRLVTSVISVLCAALERSPEASQSLMSYPEARVAICQALAAASSSPWTATAAEVQQMVPTVLALFQPGVEGELVTTEMLLACEVLRHLAVGSEVRQQQIMSHSGFEIIFGATQLHKENVELLKTALEVLSLLRTATPQEDKQEGSPAASSFEAISDQPSDLLESSSSDDDDEDEDEDETEPDELTQSPGGSSRPTSAPVGAPPEGSPVLKPSSPPATKLASCVDGFPAAPDDILECRSGGNSSSMDPEPFYASDKTLVSEMILHDLERLASEQRGVLVYDCFEELSTVERGGQDRLKFESHFESGNLRRAVWVGDNEYDLMLKLDVNTKGNTQWYYFTVSEMKPGLKYKFNMINLLKPDSQYNYGMQPLLYSEKEAAAGWRRTGDNICYYANHHGSKKKGCQPFFTLTFRMEFKHAKDRCHLAYCYPYTFSRLQRYLERLSSSSPAHIRRRSLCQTLGGFSCDLLTITDFDCTPEQMRRRRGVVLTARVHPGESNASWIMQGILDFLCSSCARACMLRDHFVFKIVPMLNPDGVIHGNYRCSLAGVDLNRRWAKPSKKLNPSIYYTKQMIRKLQETREVFVFCDIHGHSRKKNAFMYGCESRIRQGQQFHECILPKMLSQKAEIFSYDDCSFVVPKSKESTARVVAARELGILFAYTLEASFCGASFGRHKDAHFTPRHFEQLGHAFCETLCELNDPSKMNGVLQDLQAERRRKESRDDGDGDSDWEQNQDPGAPDTTTTKKKKKKSKDTKDKERRGSERKDGKKGSRKLGKIKKTSNDENGNALTSRIRRTVSGVHAGHGLKRQVSAPGPSSATLPLPSQADVGVNLLQDPSDWHSRRRSTESLSRHGTKTRNSARHKNNTTVIVKVGSRNKDR